MASFNTPEMRADCESAGPERSSADRHDLAIAWVALSAAEGGDRLADLAGTIEPIDGRLKDAIGLGCRRSTRPGTRFGWTA